MAEAEAEEGMKARMKYIVAMESRCEVYSYYHWKAWRRCGGRALG